MLVIKETYMLDKINYIRQKISQLNKLSPNRFLSKMSRFVMNWYQNFLSFILWAFSLQTLQISKIWKKKKVFNLVMKTSKHLHTCSAPCKILLSEDTELNKTTFVLDGSWETRGGEDMSHPLFLNRDTQYGHTFLTITQSELRAQDLSEVKEGQSTLTWMDFHNI